MPGLAPITIQPLCPKVCSLARPGFPPLAGKPPNDEFAASVGAVFPVSPHLASRSS